jgi:hypothetical protein
MESAAGQVGEEEVTSRHWEDLVLLDKETAAEQGTILHQKQEEAVAGQVLSGVLGLPIMLVLVG